MKIHSKTQRLEQKFGDRVRVTITGLSKQGLYVFGLSDSITIDECSFDGVCKIVKEAIKRASK